MRTIISARLQAGITFFTLHTHNGSQAINDPRTTRESTVPITHGITEIFFSPPSKHYPDRSVLIFHCRDYDGLHIVSQWLYIWEHPHPRVCYL